MSIITLDFETYYAQDFSLSKLTTEEYIRSKKFEVIGVGVKVDDHPAEWFSGEHEIIKSRLTTLFDWENSALLCHNTAFDGAILAWRYGIVPHIYLDTLCMARAIHGVDAGGSLASLSQLYKIGEKGTEVLDAKGAHRADFTPEGLAQYGEYCKNDVELTRKLFDIFAPQFPVSELKLIDITLRMFTQPVLELDDVMLTERLDELQDEKLTLLGSLKQTLNVETEEEVRKKLASNKQFAQVLTDLGVCQYPNSIKDWSDTAGLMHHLDLVIGVDTSISHLAGAMGKPLWVMLPQYALDWRWLLDRDDSPWYPSAKLFRQPVRGDWNSVIDKITQYLSWWKN